MSGQPRGDYARLVATHFPDIDTLTRAEYHRLCPDQPAPYRPPPAPPTLNCAACGEPFVPHPHAARPRFCSRTCRVWFHYGPGAKTRKVAAA